MIAFFVKRPVTTIMFVLLFVVLGIVSFFNLYTEETPKVEFPIVTITTLYPGATPQEVETLVVNKIEDAVSELSEIKKIRSQSYENSGFVFVEFLLSADVNIKFIEVKDKVEAILNDLPADIEKPVIEKFDPLISPVMELVLYSDTVDEITLFEFVDKKFKDNFSSISGVANVEVYGGKERQINITLDPNIMMEKYITILDVVSAINKKNMNIPGGLLEEKLNSLSMRFVGEYLDVSQIAKTEIISRDGRKFLLEEIALVEDSFKKIDSIARFKGKSCVGISLNKVSDGNAVNIAKEVKQRMEEFRSYIPKDSFLEIASDNTEFIVSETWDTEVNIFIGIGLTVLVLLLFTGNFWTTLISFLVIPSSIISCMFLADLSGFTINMMTLLGIATCLGTLIANAIVIIESVLAHMDKGKDSVTAAIDGTKEVTVAILASAGTNLVVFTPIAFMGGIVGQFMISFGLVVIYATLFSLAASFTLTPMLCGMFLKSYDPKGTPVTKWYKYIDPFPFLVRATHHVTNKMIFWYKPFFHFSLRHPVVMIMLFVFMMYNLKFILPYIGSEFLSKSDRDKIIVDAVLPQGSTIERSLDVVKVIEDKISQQPEVVSYLTRIGENGLENSTITVELTPSSERKRSDVDIINDLIPFAASIPDAEIVLRQESGDGGTGGDISLNIRGNNFAELKKKAADAKKIMEDSGYFFAVTSSYKMPKKEVQFIPDQETLNSYAVSNVLLGQTIRASLYGDDDNKYKEEGEEYDINIELDPLYTEYFSDISRINIISKKGLIPIMELGAVKQVKAFAPIWHRDKETIIRLEGYLAKATSGEVMAILTNKFKQELNLEKEIDFKYVEDAENQDESQRELGKAFFLAIVLTYMLLAALMNSFLYPLPILLSVVTSFTGVFLTLFACDLSISIGSMLAMVMLVGLVVNNSILMLDHALSAMKEGVGVKEALWIGSSEKLHAILMTSIAIILGALPQMFSIVGFKKGMGGVIVGGMAASVIFTFVFTPVFFYIAERFKHLFHK